MSRVGKKEITFDSSVKVELKDQTFNVQGKKGKLSINIPEGLQVDIDGEKIVVNPTTPNKNHSKSMIRFYEKKKIALWGTIRQLISNSIEGVSKGFKKQLVLEGVGFRAAVSGHKLTLNIGYSHPIEYLLPEGISASVENNTTVTIDGFDKQMIGKVAAEIRSLRKPEPYKGKGIRYKDEVVRRKAGKTAKK